MISAANAVSIKRVQLIEAAAHLASRDPDTTNLRAFRAMIEVRSDSEPNSRKQEPQQWPIPLSWKFSPITSDRGVTSVPGVLKNSKQTSTLM
jgi:hypothetical protein